MLTFDCKETTGNVFMLQREKAFVSTTLDWKKVKQPKLKYFSVIYFIFISRRSVK